MRRTHLLCAIVLVFWWVEGGGGQSAPPVALSAELRAHVEAERFQVVTSLRGLPLGVRDALQSLLGSQLVDAGPGAEPGAGATASEETTPSDIPTRRLLVAGCSYDHCLVYYERQTADRAWRVLLLHWAPEATRVEWGAAASNGLRSIDEVRSAVVSGGTVRSDGPW